MRECALTLLIFLTTRSTHARALTNVMLCKMPARVYTHTHTHTHTHTYTLTQLRLLSLRHVTQNHTFALPLSFQRGGGETKNGAGETFTHIYR